MTRHFMEVDYYQERKHSQAACGDVFLSEKIAEDHRVISVLADGLGSGIKANVLANLTSTMAIRYMESDMDVRKAARTIMATLPVCRERQIAYSTFTIVEMDPWGATRVLEYDNPPSLLLRGAEPVPIAPEILPLPDTEGREAELRHARFEVRPGDRIVFFSDGVTQAGVGSEGAPLGWGQAAVTAYLSKVIRERPRISARQLARTLVLRAKALDGGSAKDDISCAVMYYREPREVLVLTGAPVSRDQDPEMAEIAQSFTGRKVICGGTTSAILGRELGRALTMDLRNLDPDVPPISRMEGFDLVTEGAITLARMVRLLEEEDAPDLLKPNAATQLAGILLDSDIIHIVAGTKINEALQDPSLPEDLDIRRNILRGLKKVLTEKYLKEVRIRFI
ncbi:PP2C family protein-serine/threonine phosphatase [Mesoterricola silvestris]|uniref:Serine/threonine phosphatase n=1 Tax=Mesoterricola silvestris TaxID=2927979 RepID=A0AA48GNR1_9BACT|nr:PP2C family protein-serine/threonine phosphatase [Mesoterricola silvestris]BDU71207.1 serine/threonine phosphatase [Mesoterricola silvestris]